MLPTDAPTLNPTAEPSFAPTQGPTAAPSTTPTVAPTYWEFLNSGDSAQESFDGLSTEEQAAVGAGVGGLVLILIIAGVAAAAIIVVAILATATGVFIRHKIMHKLDNHTFEGELVAIDAVPMGHEVEAPEWAHEDEYIQEQQKQQHRASRLPTAGLTSVNPLRSSTILASGEA